VIGVYDIFTSNYHQNLSLHLISTKTKISKSVRWFTLKTLMWFPNLLTHKKIRRCTRQQPCLW